MKKKNREGMWSLIIIALIVGVAIGYIVGSEDVGFSPVFDNSINSCLDNCVSSFEDKFEDCDRFVDDVDKYAECLELD
jgi:hypothetical protein